VPTDDLPDYVRHHRWLLGSRLRQTRLEQELTQEDLARMTGVDSKTISRTENGHHNVGIDLVARLAHALGVPSWTLFEER
jgi:transcriptional regulator with XRE-family HTH domain